MLTHLFDLIIRQLGPGENILIFKMSNVNFKIELL